MKSFVASSYLSLKKKVVISKEIFIWIFGVSALFSVIGEGHMTMPLPECMPVTVNIQATHNYEG